MYVCMQLHKRIPAYVCVLVHELGRAKCVAWRYVLVYANTFSCDAGRLSVRV